MRHEYHPPHEAAQEVSIIPIPDACILNVETDNFTRELLDPDFKFLSTKDYVRKNGLFTVPINQNLPTIHTDAYAV